MSWKDTLRKHLKTPNQTTSASPENTAHETRARQTAHLRAAMRAASTACLEAHALLVEANRHSTFEHGDELHGLVLDGRRLEVTLADDTIVVRREYGPVAKLRVEETALVDERGTRLLFAEEYFGSLVLDLVIQ